MEAFSLLNYWRPGRTGAPHSAAAPGANTILTALDSDDNDDGPFFDLEFTVPDEDHDDDNVSNCAEDGKQNDSAEDFDLSSSRSCNGDRTETDPISDEVEPSQRFVVSFLRSATKFGGLILGLKKSKQSTVDKTEPDAEEAESKEKKLFTVKFRVEEFPILSLFAREHTTSVNKSPAVPQKHITEPIPTDEKLFSKDAMHKYLKKVKPLYIRVSRRYGEKLRFSGPLALGSGAKPPQFLPEPQKPSPPLEPGYEKTTQAMETVAPPGYVKSQKQGNFPAGFRVVCKHLGKSLSAPAPSGAVASKRRDDSLLQQQDGIQSAILHCKRSFNASRDSGSSSGCESEREPKPDGEKSRKSFEEDGA